MADTPCELFTSPTYMATIIYLWSMLTVFPFKVVLSFHYRIVTARASWRLQLIRCALLLACVALSATGLFFYGYLVYVSNDVLMFLEPSRPLPLPGIRRIPWFDAMIPHHILSLVFFTVGRFVTDCQGMTAIMYIMLARTLLHELILLVYAYHKVASWHWPPLSWVCFVILALTEAAFVPILWILTGNPWAAVLFTFDVVDIECELVFSKLARFGTTKIGLRGPRQTDAAAVELEMGIEALPPPANEAEPKAGARPEIGIGAGPEAGNDAEERPAESFAGAAFS